MNLCALRERGGIRTTKVHRLPGLTSIGIMAVKSKQPQQTIVLGTAIQFWGSPGRVSLRV